MTNANFEVGPDIPPPQHDWLRRTGADLAATADPDFPILIGYDMVLSPVGNRSWETITAEDIRKERSLETPETEVTTFADKSEGGPDTYFFRTREHGRGILQVLGNSTNPPGVKIRYKLIADSIEQEQGASAGGAAIVDHAQFRRAVSGGSLTGQGGRRSGTRSGLPGGSGMTSSRMPVASLQAPTDASPARFEATVYEVCLAAERLDELDAQALQSKASTAPEFAEALSKFDNVRMLYKVDQTVNLHGESIMLGTSELTGQHEESLIVGISGSPEPNDPAGRVLFVEADFEILALDDAPLQTSSQVEPTNVPGLDASAALIEETPPQLKTARVRKVSLCHSDILRLGQPQLLVNASAGRGDKVKAVAYVIRYAFREIKY